MIKIDNKEQCCGCEACKQVCPKHCISMSYDDEGFIYTPIRDKIAISCMLRQIHEFSSHAIRHGLYIKNRKRLFCP